MRLTSNDLALNALCPNILSYKDRHIEFSNTLSKYNLELAHIREFPELYINVLIYRCLEEYLKDLDIDIKTLEALYNGYTSGLVGDVISVPLLAKGWMRLVEIYNKLFKILEGYDLAYTNIEFHKSTRIRRTFNFKIDALLMRKNSSKVTLLTIVPTNHSHITSHVTDNPDTMFGLEYVYESGLNLDEVIEISYARGFGDKSVNVRRIYPKSLVKEAITKIISDSDNSRINTFYCVLCPYNKKCTLRDRVKGKNII